MRPIFPATVILDRYRLIVSAGDLSAAILVPGAIRQRKETFVRIESGNIWVIDVPDLSTEVLFTKKCYLALDCESP